MTTYAVAPNDRTSFYEIHKVGCRHLALGKFPYSVPKDGDTAAAVAAAGRPPTRDA